MNKDSRATKHVKTIVKNTEQLNKSEKNQELIS